MKRNLLKASGGLTAVLSRGFGGACWMSAVLAALAFASDPILHSNPLPLLASPSFQEALGGDWSTASPSSAVLE
jgi:hypothetical protein